MGTTYSLMRRSSLRFATCIVSPDLIARANSVLRWSVSFAFRICSVSSVPAISSRPTQAHFVLTVDPCLDLARLNERDDLPLELIDGPPERAAHAFEFDGRERLEVLYERTAADQVRYIRQVAPDVQVKRMTRLHISPNEYS